MAASAYPQTSRYLLQGAFQFFPPPCPTYLLTDEHPRVDDQNPDMKIFEPVQDTLQLARLEEDLQQEVAAHTDSAGHVHLQHDVRSNSFKLRLSFVFLFVVIFRNLGDRLVAKSNTS